jgi:hypothetical protein
MHAERTDARKGYERTDDPRDPLNLAQDSAQAAYDELLEFRYGAPDSNDRAILDRVKNHLKNAMARIDDVERATRPLVEHRHPGEPRRPGA